MLGAPKVIRYSMRMNPTSEPTHSVPHLVHKEAFKTALANYRISERAQKVLADTKLVLLLAATASGRNTIIDRLVASGNYHFIVSDTTRPPRVNKGVPEQNGREYWFRNEEDVLADIRQGEFLEAELIHEQQVSGISIRELEKATREKKVAITEVDLGGFLGVIEARPETIGIIILPPSFDEWQRRITGRGDMNPVEFKRRIETAVRIFEVAATNERITLVINDEITEAATRVDEIARMGIAQRSSQESGRALARELQQQTQRLLDTL